MHRGAESGGAIDIRRLHLAEALTIRRQPRQDSILFIFLFLYFSFLAPPPRQSHRHWLFVGTFCSPILLDPYGPTAEAIMSRTIIKLHGEERMESVGGKQPSAAVRSSKMDVHQLVGQRSRWP